jgi:hypothetical protein
MKDALLRQKRFEIASGIRRPTGDRIVDRRKEKAEAEIPVAVENIQAPRPRRGLASSHQLTRDPASVRTLSSGTSAPLGVRNPSIASQMIEIKRHSSLPVP